jgi:hypothetical protein
MIKVFFPSLQRISHVLVQADIIDLGKRGHHLFEDLDFLLGDELGYPAARVPQIPKYHGIGRAGLHTGRWQARINPMNTEIALLEHASDRIRESDIVRAGCSAIVATDTPVRIDQDDAIVPLVSGSHRTYRVTDRPFTMVAQPG